MNDSPMLRALSAIQVTVHKHLSLNQNQPITQHAPSFDTRTVHSPLKSTLPGFPGQLSSFGLSAEVAAEINNVLTTESHNYQASIAHSRQQLLDDLSTTTVSSDPQALPPLISAACQQFYNSTVDSCLDSVHKHLSEYTHGDGPFTDPEEVSESEDNSSCQSHDEDESDDGIEGQDAEDDDNAPMKAGEEVPPLETKYLPIFEALHERGKVLTKPEKTYLVNMTGMTYRQITIWFQNRRRGELKEDANRAYVSRAESVHSFSSSDISDEFNLEQRLSNTRSDTTFDICSWRLTSAFPTKDGIPGSSAPPSPTKLSFGPAVTTIDSGTNDTDLSDSDDEALVPPGLHGPSLSMSTTTSASMESIQATTSVIEPLIVSATPSNAERALSTRPIKSLPISHLNSFPRSTQPTQAQVASVFNGGSAQLSWAPLIGQSSAPVPTPSPTQSVTSNERGLTVHMNTVSQTSNVTLPSFSSTPPTRSPDGSLPSPSNSTTISPQRNISPTPSAHSASSPRPPVKPLPRRTGCAPRPRPPPRPSPSSVMTPTTAPSSARASVVLPPSSNPSLGNTTLGSLLRPNQPAPRIPPEMEERLAAMAGRMGVSKDVDCRSNTRQTTGVAPTAARSGFVVPSFGPTSLPRLNMPSGSTSTSALGQSLQNSSRSSQQ